MASMLARHPHATPLTLKFFPGKLVSSVFLVKTKAIYSSFLILGVGLSFTSPSAQQPVPSVSPTPSSDQLVGGPTWQLSVSWMIKSPSQATGLSSRAPC